MLEEDAGRFIQAIDDNRGQKWVIAGVHNLRIWKESHLGQMQPRVKDQTWTKQDEGVMWFQESSKLVFPARPSAPPKVQLHNFARVAKTER